MLPADQSEIRFFSALNAFFYKVKQWVAAEIVDDDPWDGNTSLPLSELRLSESPLPETVSPECLESKLPSNHDKLD